MARLKLIGRLAQAIGRHRPLNVKRFDGTLKSAPFWAGWGRDFEEKRLVVFETAIAKLTPEEIRVIEEAMNESLLHWWDSWIEPLLAGIERLSDGIGLAGGKELSELEFLGRSR